MSNSLKAVVGSMDHLAVFARFLFCFCFHFASDFSTAAFGTAITERNIRSKFSNCSGPSHLAIVSGCRLMGRGVDDAGFISFP